MEGGLYRVNVHIVVKGDTLWKIARQYGISFEELKKVNAHLANPDYIVPGMKIFLPEGKGTKPHQKQAGKEKQPQPHEKPMTPAPQPAPPVAPIPKPAPPAQQPLPPQKPTPPPPKPAPKPEVKPQPVPKPEVKPQPMPKPPAPPKPEVKPMPKPESPNYEAPPAPPMPPVQQQPMVHPMFIGIPCGWMPIYDADCHPCMHPMQHHMHHQPMASPMMPPVPVQPPQWNMQPESPECKDESPIMAGQGPGVSPNHCDSMKKWESPTVQMPSNESSGFDLSPPAYCPPEQGYIPQQMAPQGYSQHYPSSQQMPMQGIQAAQHPQYMHLCSSCGTTMSPTPYYGMPMMGVQPYYGGYPQMSYPPQGNHGQNQLGSY